MAPLTGKAKAKWLRKINKGRKAAGLKPIRAKRAKGAPKAKRAPATKKASSKPRKKRRTAKQIAATKRMIAARRAQLKAGSRPAKTKRPSAKKGHANMAKKKGKKKSGAHKKYKKARRKRGMSITVSHPRKVTLINPGPSNIMGLLGTAVTGVAGEAAAGYAVTRFLGSQSAGLRAGATIALGLLGSLFLKKRPGLATAWGASVIGTIGYGLGVKAAGGVVAANKAEAVAQLAQITGTTAAATGTSGLGVLTRRGVGLLTPRGVGATRTYGINGMGASNLIAPVRQPMVYS